VLGPSANCIASWTGAAVLPSDADTILNVVQNTTYSITCDNVEKPGNANFRGYGEATILIQPRIKYFDIQPRIIVPGWSVLADWEAVGGPGLSCEGFLESGIDGDVNPWVVPLPSPNGSNRPIGSLVITSAFRVSCVNDNGIPEASFPITVTVNEPTAGISASPRRILEGKEAKITWEVNDVQSAEIREVRTVGGIQQPPTIIDINPIIGEETYPNDANPYSIYNETGTFFTGPLSEGSVRYILYYETLTDPGFKTVDVNITTFIPKFDEE
jgi:hypothetical protein